MSAYDKHTGRPRDAEGGSHTPPPPGWAPQRWQEKPPERTVPGWPKRRAPMKWNGHEPE